MRRADLPPSPRHTFVVPERKLVYVATPKVACSTIKWVVAEIAGEDLDLLRKPTNAIAASAIHQRKFWHHARTLHDLSDQELAEIDPANGWHVFAVVRHPTGRLWSAWQQKVLLRAPRVVGLIPEDMWPELPRSAEAIADGFGRFAVGLAEGRHDDVLADAHFTPQRRILAPGRMPYSKVYTISELPQAMADLDAHVQANGGAPIPGLTSSNETPLRPLRSAFTDEVQAAVRRVYRGDLREWFADDDVVPSGTVDDYTPAQLDAALRAVHVPPA